MRASEACPSADEQRSSLPFATPPGARTFLSVNGNGLENPFSVLVTLSRSTKFAIKFATYVATDVMLRPLVLGPLSFSFTTGHSEVRNIT